MVRCFTCGTARGPGQWFEYDPHATPSPAWGFCLWYCARCYRQEARRVYQFLSHPTTA